MSLIEIKNLNKNYKEKHVLSEVNLNINQGDFIALTGESGSGKTTLLNIIGGLETPSSGEIIIDGQNISNLKSKERVKFYQDKVSFIFQGFYLQNSLTVKENIELPLIFANKKPNQINEIAKYLKIDDILNNKITEISGGQAERVCIARALITNPKIILADEPTNNLDEDNIRNILEIFKKINQEQNITIIISGHDSTVKTFANKIIKIEHGGLREIS